MIASSCKRARPVKWITITPLIFRPLISLFWKEQLGMLCLLTSNHLSGSCRVTLLTMYWISVTAVEMPLWKKRDLFTSGNYMLICAEPFSFSPKVIFSKSWYINIWRLFTSECTLICATYYSVLYSVLLRYCSNVWANWLTLWSNINFKYEFCPNSQVLLLSKKIFFTSAMFHGAKIQLESICFI